MGELVREAPAELVVGPLAPGGWQHDLRSEDPDGQRGRDEVGLADRRLAWHGDRRGAARKMNHREPAREQAQEKDGNAQQVNYRRKRSCRPGRSRRTGAAVRRHRADWRLSARRCVRYSTPDWTGRRRTERTVRERGRVGQNFRCARRNGHVDARHERRQHRHQQHRAQNGRPHGVTRGIRTHAHRRQNQADDGREETDSQGSIQEDHGFFTFFARR